MTLVVTLLKLILISKNSRTHLESRIADLIRYYEAMPEQECRWVVNFLEIFNVTFTIYAENVQYDLIRMTDRSPGDPRPGSFNFTSNGELNLDSYRIFSQLKSRQLPDDETLPNDLEGEDEIVLSDGDGVQVLNLEITPQEN